jgi:hypothetical protein
MRFSLKFMLIAVCVIGAYAGIMSRLFYESPEQFFTAFIISYTVGPFLLAIGTIIWLAIRQNPLVGSRRNLLIWGIVLLFVPMLGFVVTNTVLPMRDPLHYLTNYRLIHNRLVGHENEPWAWNELTNRINKQALSKAEVEECMGDLIAYMKLAKPGGWNEPMPWQSPFLRAESQANLISEEVLYELCDAYYGSKPSLKIINADRKGFHLEVENGGHWSMGHSGVDIDLIWYVNRALIDGVPVNISDGHGIFDWMWQADLPVKLEPGEHEVVAEVECGYIDHKNRNGLLSRFSPDKWPATLKRWTTSASAKFTVPGDQATTQQVSPQSN